MIPRGKSNNFRTRNGKYTLRPEGIRTAVECLAGHVRSAHEGRTEPERCAACRELLGRVEAGQKGEANEDNVVIT